MTDDMADRIESALRVRAARDAILRWHDEQFGDAPRGGPPAGSKDDRENRAALARLLNRAVAEREGTDDDRE